MNKKRKKGRDGERSITRDEDRVKEKQEEMRMNPRGEMEKKPPFQFVGACFEYRLHEHWKVNCLRFNSGGSAGGAQGNWRSNWNN